MCIHSSMLPVQQTTEQNDCVTCTSDLKRYNVCSLIKAHHACFCNLLTNGSIRNQIVHISKVHKPWLECAVLSFVDFLLKLCNPFINCERTDLPCKIDGHLAQSMPSAMPNFKFSFSFLQYKALDAL